MRPLRLTMNAFGPYAKRQVIDFEDLKGRRLFLIHGPTGGGKTTILDAICYALYGETSGERKGEQMRSHLASADTLTEVELEFAVSEKRYRARRSPRQKRPKKRGEGDVEVNPEAELAEGDGPLGGYTTIASGESKVRDKVVDLLGFQANQFRQVIMLPQGKFRELLLADSKDREAILEMLFGTEDYEHLQTLLVEEARGLDNDLKQATQKQKLILAQAQVENAEALAAALDERKQAVARQDVALAQLREAETNAQALLDAAKKTAEMLDELDGARKRIVELKAQEPKIAAWKKQMDAAERAQKVAAEEQAVRDRTNDMPNRKKAAEIAAVALRNASAAQEKAALELLKVQKQKPEAEAGRQTLTKLDALRPRILRLEQAQRDLSTARAKGAEQESRLKKHKDTIALATEAAEKLARQVAELREQAAGLDGQRQLYKQAQTHFAQRKQLDELTPAVVRHRAQLQSCKEQEAKAGQELLKAKGKLADLFLAWKNGRAAGLAQDLRAGEPCPVCGSHEHPAPAHLAGQVPGDEELNQAQRRVEALLEAEKQAAKALSEHEKALAEHQSREAAVREGLAMLADAPLAQLQAEIESCRAKGEAAAAAQKQLPQTQAQLDQATRDAKSAQQQAEALDAELATSRSAVTTLQTLCEECLNDLPEQFRTVAAVEAEHKRVQKIVADIEIAMAAAEETAGKATAALAGAQEADRSTRTELAAADQQLKAAQETFATRLQEVGFASPHEFMAARLPHVEITRLREQISGDEQAVAAVADRLTRAEQAAAGLVRPDMAAVQQAYSSAKRQCNEAVQRRSDLEAQRKMLARLQEDLAQAAAEFAKLDAQYGVIGKMAEVANGRNPKNLKLHRFVLGFLLDDVLSAATQRLRTMSRGRYQLQRMQQIEDRRIVGGLDLEVFDAHTGSARPVATLSGGESFQASLSLSLGLADVVQARSGGIRMETMFVDEGFGSLDSEALDEAIRAIQDLQKSGRTVGIISHVPELRQLVNARLEVTSGPAGSSAAFHVV